MTREEIRLKNLATSLVLLILTHQTFSQEKPDKNGIKSRILSYERENNGIDGYKFTYVLSDNTLRTESGGFIDGVWTVTGFVVWDSPDGRRSYSYRADDKGSFFSPISTGSGGFGGGGGLSSASLSSLAGVG